MLKVGIIGASGYTGAELARILAKHPGVELTLLTSRQYAGMPIAQVFPHLNGVVDLICQDVDIADLPQHADLFFTAVPHKTAMSLIPTILAAGKKVIDLSADFRIKDPLVYEEWYQAHTAREELLEAVYGLPELYRKDIKGARLIANPGCYPTSIILALAPLLQKGLLDISTIIADSKSGTSGAGRSAQVAALFCEVNDGFRAYKVGEHRHTPEIEQELGLLAGEQVNITFTPHLLPISRGILSTMYATLSTDIDENGLHEIYDDFYHKESFVRLCKDGMYPATQYVRGSNFCDIGFKLDRRTGRIVVISAIDNVVKGAAGQAVQNMNIISGFAEGEGLALVPLFP